MWLPLTLVHVFLCYMLCVPLWESRPGGGIYPPQAGVGIRLQGAGKVPCLDWDGSCHFSSLFKEMIICMDGRGIKSILLALLKLKALCKYYLWIPKNIPMFVFFSYRCKNLKIKESNWPSSPRQEANSNAELRTWATAWLRCRALSNVLW